MATVPEVIEANLRAAGIPVLGVSTGTYTDRSTWRVDFDPSATAAQRTQAASLLSTVAVDAAALAAQDDKNAQAQIDALQLELQAIVFTLIDELNILRAAVVPALAPRTRLQARNAIRVTAGGL